MEKKLKKVAVIDGSGDHAEVELSLRSRDEEIVHDLPWPSDWPKWVSVDFLKSHGFSVRIA